MARLVAVNWVELTQGPMALNNIPALSIAGFSFLKKQSVYWLVLCVSIAAFILIARLVHSRAGRAMVALAENEPLATSVGIDVTRYLVLATVVSARWTYGAGDVQYGALWGAVRDTLLASFADHYSPSVQFTLHRMGSAVLERHPEVARIHLSLPNRHHLLVDLSPFGLDNPNQVFVATEAPYGLIEATVERPPDAATWEAAPGEAAARTGAAGANGAGEPEGGLR